MLYTGKGDDGKTKTFGCDQRISKGSSIAEALGALDEANSFLGLVKIKSEERDSLKILGVDFKKIINDIQQNLFIVQAEVAGSEMSISEEKLKECEDYINEGERLLPPIKSFFVSGGMEIAALCDISRTMIRKSERRVVLALDNGELKNINKTTLAYLNRLSSLLYVMARLANYLHGINEDAPSYK